MAKLILIEEEMILFKKSIESFIKNEIEPQDGNASRELWRKLGDSGFLCIDIPEQYGGLGVPFQYSASIVDEFSRCGYQLVSEKIAEHSNLVAYYILKAGTEEQKMYYLPKMATGELIGALTESNKITAVKNKLGHYDLHGAMRSENIADLFLVMAKTKPGRESLFIVEASNGQILSSQLLGELHNGQSFELPRERLIMAIAACGAMDGVLETTLKYLKEKPSQVIRHKVAEMVTEAKVNRAYVNQCLKALVNQQLTIQEANMAKLSSVEVLGRIVEGCRQLISSNDNEWLARVFREAKSDDSKRLKEIISEQLFDNL